jgi:hypothetical protein
VQELRTGRTLTAPATRGAAISTLGWIIVVAAAWLAVAAVVGVLVGRVMLVRDRQVPRAPDPPRPSSSDVTEDVATRRVSGRSRRRS